MASWLLEACQWLAATPISLAIRESDNAFSVIETLHVLGITATAGLIALVDLRLLGAALSQSSVPEVVDPLVRAAWIGFALMAASGLLLFAAEAADLYWNAAFRLKLIALLGLAVNQWLFHARRLRARPAAVASLALWLMVIVLGRSIAYLA